MYDKPPHASLRCEVVYLIVLLLEIPNVGVVVVVSRGATKVEVGSVTKGADIKHMTVLDGTTIETRIGIRIQGAERTSGVVAVQGLADSLRTIVVDAYAVGADGGAAPGAVEGNILRTVAVHVGSYNISGLIDAVVINILLVAGNEANSSSKKGNSHHA